MARAESIYVVADIHGSEVCWRKFLNAAKFYGVDTIVVAGDITGKALVPLVERSDGRVGARIAGRVQVDRNIVWMKMASLAEGAKLASAQLW